MNSLSDPNSRRELLPQNFNGLTFSHSSAPAKPASPSIGVEFVLYAISRWWKTATLLGLVLGSAAVAGIWLASKPVYRSTATVKIENRRPSLVYEQAESTSFVRTQIQAIRGMRVISSVIARPEIASTEEILEQEAPAEWLASKITVMSLGDSELFNISCEAERPEFAKLVANAVVDEYQKLEQDEANEHITKIVTELNKLKDQRKEALQAIKATVMAKSELAGGPGYNSNALVLTTTTPLSAIEERRAQAEVERMLLQAERDNLAQENSPEEPEGKQDDGKGKKTAKQSVAALSNFDLERLLEDTPEYKDLQNQLAFQKSIRKEAIQRAVHGALNPSVKKIDQRISQLEQSLNDLKNELIPTYLELAEKGRKAEHEQKIAELDKRIQHTEAYEKLLASQTENQRKKQTNTGRTSLDLEFAKDDLAREEAVFDKISVRIMEIQTEKQAPNRVKIHYAAQLPLLPAETSVIKKMALGGGVCFLLPFVLAVVWERQVRRISGAQQVISDAHLPVIAEIAVLPAQAVAPGQRVSLRYERLRGVFEESIDQLRTSLTLPDNMQNIRVLAVCSAVSGEGKTSVASQLAVSLARTCREPILLIDGDMRKPELHEMFDIPLEPGLAQVLDGQTTLDDAVAATWSELVHVLPAGRLHKNPHVLATTAAVNRLIQDVRNRYRYVIIDSPPLLSAGEAFVMAKSADGAVVCTMRDLSRSHQVKSACERLLSAGVRPLGIVLSGIPSRAYAYQYGRYAYGRAERT